jgi:sortase (surface protein transpeptidase)
MNRQVAALVVAFAAPLALTGQGAAGAVPGRLDIPSIGVRAQIVEVGLTSSGSLAIGDRLRGTVYAWRKADPPCDPTGTTVYAGHAWRAGNGVADKWGSLRRGDRIRVSGCAFEVTRKELWSAKRPMRHLFTVGGPPRIVLIGCKPDDYSRRVVVFAEKVR